MHMIDDHHGPGAWRANLLVRAVDGILGTHSLMRAFPCQVCRLPTAHNGLIWVWRSHLCDPIHTVITLGSRCRLS